MMYNALEYSRIYVTVACVYSMTRGKYKQLCMVRCGLFRIVLTFCSFFGGIFRQTRQSGGQTRKVSFFYHLIYIYMFIRRQYKYYLSPLGSQTAPRRLPKAATSRVGRFSSFADLTSSPLGSQTAPRRLPKAATSRVGRFFSFADLTSSPLGSMPKLHTLFSFGA